MVFKLDITLSMQNIVKGFKTRLDKRLGLEASDSHGNSLVTATPAPRLYLFHP